jgi:hypothetical protein
LVCALGALALVGLAGCTSQEYELPTRGGTRPSQELSLAAVAKVYFDCMTEAGIQLALDANFAGELSVVSFTGQYDLIMWRGPNGGGALGDGDDPATQEAVNAFFASPASEPGLSIDGVDHSATYARCLGESGYDENRAWGDMVVADPERISRQVEANNLWARCARENNWPAIVDSDFPTGTEYPTIFLPSTITEEQLRDLLVACPNFDQAAQEQYAEWQKDHPLGGGFPAGWLPAPALGIEPLDFLWQPTVKRVDSIPTRFPNPAEQAEIDQHLRLWDILFEAHAAWESQWYGGSGKG